MWGNKIVKYLMMINKRNQIEKKKKRENQNTTMNGPTAQWRSKY